MFYTHFLLAKKGPLAKVWLAAHWDKKLTKTNIFETDIKVSVDAIVHPKVKLALRTSGHLLLGVVKIYSRKLNYLLGDCSETIMHIKMAFRPGLMDDCMVTTTVAPSLLVLHENLLPEALACDRPDLLSDLQLTDRLAELQCRNDEISLREEVPMFGYEEEDDNFMGLLGRFGLEEGQEGKEEEPSMECLEGLMNNVEVLPVAASEVSGIEDSRIEGGREGVSVNLFDTSNTIQSVHGLPVEPQPTTTTTATATAATTTTITTTTTTTTATTATDMTNTSENDMSMVSDRQEDRAAFGPLILKPIEETVAGATIKKKARHLVVDSNKCLPSNLIRKNVKDTHEILAKFQLAPPTRILMRLKYNNACERLLSTSSRQDIYSNKLRGFYEKNIFTKSEEGEKEEEEEEANGRRKRLEGMMMMPSPERSQMGVDEVRMPDEADVSVRSPRLGTSFADALSNHKASFASRFDSPSMRSIEVMRDDQSRLSSPLMDVSRPAIDASGSLSKEYQGRASGVMDNSVSIASPVRVSDSLIDGTRDADMDVIGGEVGSLPEGRVKRRADGDAPDQRADKQRRLSKDARRRSILKELQLSSLAAQQQQEQQTPAKMSRLKQLRQQMQQQHFIFDQHEQISLPDMPQDSLEEAPPQLPSSRLSSLSLVSSQSSEEIASKKKSLDQLEDHLRKLTTRDDLNSSNENLDPDTRTNKRVTFKDLLTATSQSSEGCQLDRKFVARCFSMLLEMKKQRKVNFEQPVAMGDIYITMTTE